MNPRKLFATSAAAALLALGFAACGSSDDSSTTSADGSSGSSASGISGTLDIDGSSTVGPLTQAVSEQFAADNPDLDVTVGTSGTGGGFEKFCAGETVMNDASRPIDPKEEVPLCKKNGIDYEEVQVANDALTVVVNNANPVTCLTVDQLAQIWRPDNPVSSWSDVTDLDPAYDADLERFGPGSSSGTFDYFSGAVNGEEGVLTKDFNNVGEDDNQTVTGVEGSEGGIGYFGFSYYEENQGNLKALEIDGGDGCVAPSSETVQDGTYTPLGRPLFVYVNTKDLASNPAVKPFLQYYVDNVNDIAPQVGFITLTDEQLSKSQQTVGG